MSTDNHTPIPSSPNQPANAATFNIVFAELDAKMGNVATLTTTATTLTAGINELDSAIGDLSTLATPAASVVAAVGTTALGTTATTLSGAIAEIESNTSKQSVAGSQTTFTGAVDATALSIGGVPVGTSTDTYWNAVTGGIAYGSKMGIGTGAAEPAAAAEVVGLPVGTFKTSTTGNIGGDLGGPGGVIAYPTYFEGTYTTAANDGSVRHVLAGSTMTGTHNVATHAGFYASIVHNMTGGTLTHGWGLVGRFYKTGAGATVQQMAGVYSDFTISAAGTVSAAYGFYQNPGQVSAGTVSQAFMMDLNEPEVTGTGAISSNYGIRVGTTTVGLASNYGIFIEESSGYGIYNYGTNALYSGGTAEIGGTLTVGSVTSGTNTLSGDTVIYNDASVGSELLSNTTFDANTTGWTGSSATLASVAGGESNNCLEATTTGGNGFAYASVTTVAGKMYRLQFYQKRGTANQSVWIETSIGGTLLHFENLTTATDWTLRNIFFVPTTTTTFIRLSFSGSPSAGATAYWDEVSIKQVLGGDLQINGVITGYGGSLGLQVTQTGHGLWNGATDNGALNALVANAEAVPVLSLEQADVSEEILQITSTAGTGNAVEAVGAKTLTVTDFIKITLNGATRYIQAGTIA